MTFVQMLETVPKLFRDTLTEPTLPTPVKDPYGKVIDQLPTKLDLRPNLPTQAYCPGKNRPGSAPQSPDPGLLSM